MVEMINIQASGKTNIRRISAHSGQGRTYIPLAIKIGAKKVSGIHMKMKVGIWRLKACEPSV